MLFFFIYYYYLLFFLQTQDTGTYVETIKKSMASLGPQACVSKLLEHTRIAVTQLPGVQIYCRKASSTSELFSRGQSPGRNPTSKQKPDTANRSTVIQKSKSAETFDKLKSGVSNGILGLINTVNTISVPHALKNFSIPSLPSLPVGKRNGNKSSSQESQRKIMKFKEDDSVSREQHSFSQHIEETNQSIKSFYDTSLVDASTLDANVQINNNTIVDNMVKIPESVQVLAKKSENAENLAKKNSESSYWNMLNRLTIKRQGKASTIEVSKKPRRSELNSRTVDLVINIKKATSSESMHKRLTDLCCHLTQYPDCRSIAMQVRQSFKI